MRGTAPNTVGAISRTFSGTVSGFSTKLSTRAGEKRRVDADDALGDVAERQEAHALVVRVLRERVGIEPRRGEQMLACESIAPFGLPVVPEV